MTVTTLLRGGGHRETHQHYIGNNISGRMPHQHGNNKDNNAATDDTTITKRHNHDGTVSYCTATKKRNYNNNNEDNNDNDNDNIPIDDNNNNVIRNNQNNHESSSDGNETEEETEKIEPEENIDNENENENKDNSNANSIITSPPTMIISSGRSSQDGKEKIPMESTLFTWRNRNGDALLTTEAMSITRRCVIEFHPLAYLFSVTTSSTNIKKLSNEYNTKINKLNHDIDDIKNRISCIHEKVNILNKQRRERDGQSNGSNNGDNNEIYLLVRSVGMWMKRMETKTELIVKIQFSLSILNSLKEIDEICSTKMFWFYSTWRRQNIFINNRRSGDDCGNSSWDYKRVNGSNSNWEDQDQNQNDVYKNNENRHLFNGYEKAYQRNIKLSTQITNNLINSSSAAGVTADEKIVRLMEYNYIHCKGCRAFFSRRYCDLFGTEVRCPSKVKARENLITRGVTGEADGSNLVVCFFCTDCFDCFNPSIIKQIRQQKEMKKELELEELIQDCQKEQQQQQQQLSTANNNNSNHGGKQPKKRKKKKKKKQQKKSNDSTTPSPSATITTNDNDNNDCDFCSSSLATKTTTGTTELSLDINDGVDDDDLDDLNDPLDSDKSAGYGNKHEQHERITIDDITTDEKKSSKDDVNSDDPAANDVWVDFLLKTGSIIELNAFMDQTLGKD
jgi:hypothetical protein